jgi:hypothetical protein
MRVAYLVSVALLFACNGGGVGDPCEPEVVPEGGYRPEEIYVEASAPQCRTSWCIAHGLDGDPRPSCTGLHCVSTEELYEHSYCSCRCAGPGALCACPTGYSCQETAFQASFCVRDP